MKRRFTLRFLLGLVAIAGFTFAIFLRPFQPSVEFDAVGPRVFGDNIRLRHEQFEFKVTNTGYLPIWFFGREGELTHSLFYQMPSGVFDMIDWGEHQAVRLPPGASVSLFISALDKEQEVEINPLFVDWMGRRAGARSETFTIRKSTFLAPEIKL